MMGNTKFMLIHTTPKPYEEKLYEFICMTIPYNLREDLCKLYTVYIKLHCKHGSDPHTLAHSSRN